MSVSDIIETLQEGIDEYEIRRLKDQDILTDERYYGWNQAKVKRLAGLIIKENEKAQEDRIRDFHQFAQNLWATKILDARLLATFLEEPAKVTDEQIDDYTKVIHVPFLMDSFVSNVVVFTPFASLKLDKWQKSKKPLLQRATWHIIACQARSNHTLENKYFEKHLQTIMKKIHNVDSIVKEAMNQALMEIGGRNKHLNKIALETAEHIGKIEITFGSVKQKIPDARKVLTSRPVTMRFIHED